MRRALLSALAVLASLAALLVTAGPASAAHPWNHVWMESVTSGLCADATTWPPSEQVCVDVGEQLWIFDGATTGSVHRIRNAGTNECLTATGGSVVQGQTCGSAWSQKWQLIGSGNTFLVQSVGGLCVARSVSGTLVLGGCTASNRWKLLL